MKLTVMIQYHGHVVHAGGNTTYRAVNIDLTPEQSAALALREVLSDYYSQNKCGCGHPACKRCRDDRFVEDVLADTQPEKEQL